MRYRPNETSVHMQLATRHDLRSREAGNQLLRILVQEVPNIAPQKWGYWEPLRRAFDPLNVEASTEDWGKHPTWLWKRTRPSFEGGITFRLDPRIAHGEISFSGDSRAIDEEAAVRLFHRLAREFDADFGLLHIPNRAELEEGFESEAIGFLSPDGSSFGIYIPPIQLRYYIPDVYWGMVFGPSYIELFGRERLLSAPAARVAALREDLVFFQLTERLVDCQERFDSVAAARQRVKSHLDSDAFFDKGRGRYGKYRTPSFGLPPAKPKEDLTAKLNRLIDKTTN